MTVTGMTCGGCVGRVSRALRAVSGVGSVEVSLSEGKAKVTYDERLTSKDQLESAVEAAGYGVDAPPAAGSQPGKGGCCS